MTRMASKLGLLFALALTTLPAQAQDVKEMFREGVDLLRRGRKTDALAVFQKILAADPSQEEAYELWKETDYDIWLDMMVESGEIHQTALRLQELARVARKDRQNDADAIRGLVQQLRESQDPLERRRLTLQLAADHGEYAVPHLARALADESNDDWRVIATNSLAQMGTDVVPALIECLATENVYQRRNVAYLLGIIADPRAAGPLGVVAATDPDGSVVKAASAAAAKCGLTGVPLRQLLRDGDDYHHRRGTVLRPMDYSDVVWSWKDGELVSAAVPRDLYNDEMAKKAYWRALTLDSGSLDARAGLARAAIEEQAKLEMMAERGDDVGDLQEQAAVGALAAYASGLDALDLALRWSVLTDDSSTGAHLCRAIADVASASTPALDEALSSGDGAIRGEAAVALGTIAVRGHSTAAPAVVQALGEAAGREIQRVAAIIDGDTQRASAWREALSMQGVLVNHRGTGAAGVAMLHSVPGIDLILVGDNLPDLTLDAVVQNIRDSKKTSETPTFLLTANEELASTWSEHFQGSLASASDITQLDSVFEAALDGDRAEADRLSRRAAATLASLASAGTTDIGPAIARLASTLASRPDEVVIPAMAALGSAGGAQETGALAAVASADDRSDAARIAACQALGQIFARHSVDASTVQSLAGVLTSEASIDVRRAASQAIGSLRMPAEERRRILSGVSTSVSKEGN